MGSRSDSYILQIRSDSGYMRLSPPPVLLWLSRLLVGSPYIGALLAQHAPAPAFDATHLRVEFALQGLGEWQKSAEVGPAQLSRQGRDYLLLGKGLGKLHHAAQVFLAVAATYSAT